MVSKMESIFLTDTLIKCSFFSSRFSTRFLLVLGVSLGGAERRLKRRLAPPEGPWRPKRPPKRARAGFGASRGLQVVLRASKLKGFQLYFLWFRGSVWKPLSVVMSVDRNVARRPQRPMAAQEASSARSGGFRSLQGPPSCSAGL